MDDPRFIKGYQPQYAPPITWGKTGKAIPLIAVDCPDKVTYFEMWQEMADSFDDPVEGVLIADQYVHYQEPRKAPVSLPNQKRSPRALASIIVACVLAWTMAFYLVWRLV